MRKFTADEVNFLIWNEDKIPLERLAQIFECSWQEVYKVYDLATKTRNYKQYTKHRVDLVTGKIARGELRNQQNN